MLLVAQTPFGTDAVNGIDLEKLIRRTDKELASLLGAWLGQPVAHFDLFPETAKRNMLAKGRAAFHRDYVLPGRGSPVKEVGGPLAQVLEDEATVAADPDAPPRQSAEQMGRAAAAAPTPPNALPDLDLDGLPTDSVHLVASFSRAHQRNHGHHEPAHEAEPITPAPISGARTLRARFFSAPHVSPLLSGRSVPPPRLGAEAGFGFAQSNGDQPQQGAGSNALPPGGDSPRNSAGSGPVETGLSALIRSASLSHIGQQAPGDM